PGCQPARTRRSATYAESVGFEPTVTVPSHSGFQGRGPPTTDGALTCGFRLDRSRSAPTLARIWRGARHAPPPSLERPASASPCRGVVTDLGRGHTRVGRGLGGH